TVFQAGVVVVAECIAQIIHLVFQFDGMTQVHVFSIPGDVQAHIVNGGAQSGHHLLHFAVGFFRPVGFGFQHTVGQFGNLKVNVGNAFHVVNHGLHKAHTLSEFVFQIGVFGNAHQIVVNFHFQLVGGFFVSVNALQQFFPRGLRVKQQFVHQTVHLFNNFSEVLNFFLCLLNG